MSRVIPFLLLVLIGASAFVAPFLPVAIQECAYGLSLSLKSIILFLLPFLIFALLLSTAMQIAKQASKLIISILIVLCSSNLVSTLLSYWIGSITPAATLATSLTSSSACLSPAFTLSLPSLISNQTALLLGLASGLILAFFQPSFAQKGVVFVEKGISLFLKILFCIVPFFITGFIIKMVHDGMLSLILTRYGMIFLVITTSLFLYIALLYVVISKGSVTAAWQKIKNMLPASLAGMSSMSSAVAMPLTLLGVAKNANNPTIAKGVVPISVNIHLMGDCFAIPIFALALLQSFSLPIPSFIEYLPFAFYFVLAKFSVAAVPGGGILVMLPILESHLGLSGELLPLITALYILFDPVITGFNILGNGALASGIDSLHTEKKKLLRE